MSSASGIGIPAKGLKKLVTDPRQRQLIFDPPTRLPSRHGTDAIALFITVLR
jgi:hypothetical protein